MDCSCCLACCANRDVDDDAVGGGGGSRATTMLGRNVLSMRDGTYVFHLLPTGI
jgi:hypothetical protein